MDSNNTKPLEKTDNELIAEFMGFTCAETYHDRFWNPPGMPFATIYDWKYHTHHLEDFQTSWDWLMPVVEKIQVFAHLEIENGQCLISVNGELISGVVNGSNIENTYKAVVAYIKWYNSTKKP